MKLKIMTFDAIEYVKKNISKLTDHYKNGDNPEEWIKKVTGKPAFIEVPELEFDDFDLFISESNPSSTDAMNIKLLYSKFSGLNDSFASDERLWAGLAHTVFYDYMRKRWPKDYNSQAILNHFFFNGGRPRCYMINSIARLWWLGKKTIFLEDDNPNVIIDYISHDINGYAFTLFGSNWSNSERTLKQFFKAVFEFEKESQEKIGRELFNDAMKYTNCLCGIYIIDACDDSFVVNQIKDYLAIRSKERKEEAEYNKRNNVRKTGVERFDNIIKAINSIGGHGTTKQIMSAYANVIEANVSMSTKSYIKKNLKQNCIYESSFSGSSKPIFYQINVGNDKFWKISNDYLVIDNLPIRKKLMDSQIDTLVLNERIVFNTINSFNSVKFSLSDLMGYKNALMNVYTEISDMDSILKNGLNALSEKGLVELIDKENGIYKKAFIININ